MVVIGLLDIPPEIQLQIAEFVQTSQTLKALSVTSRFLRSIAQSLLFKTFQIDLGEELRGSIGDLLANPQICAAIRLLVLRGPYLLSSQIPRNEKKLSLIQKLLPEMVGLREVWIYQVNLSMAFMDSLLEMAAKIPLRVQLGWNIYPPGIDLISNTPLRISHLHLGFGTSRPWVDFYRAVFHASAATLTGLDVTADGDGLMQLAGINLPCLYDLTLVITTENELSRTSAAAFLTVQRTIRKLDLNGKVRHLPPLPPSALPDLRELKGSTELVNQLVPGRPVEAIEVNSPRGNQWFGEEVARSTARVRKLRIHHTAIREMRMVKRMVTILPSLESLSLCVFDDVSNPFARDYLDLFSFRPSSKFSKFSLPLSASRTYALLCDAKHA